MGDEQEILNKFVGNLLQNQVEIPGEITKLVNDNFWELTGDIEDGYLKLTTDLCNDDGNILVSTYCDTGAIDCTSRYTKEEIENRLNEIINNDELWDVAEDKWPAHKLINMLLESLQ